MYENWHEIIKYYLKQRIGKHVYLYESVSFRDQKGRPRSRRTSIGKIDPVTGEPVYKPEYIDLMAKRGTPLDVPQIIQYFTREQICKSTLKEYGAILKQEAEKEPKNPQYLTEFIHYLIMRKSERRILVIP